MLLVSKYHAYVVIIYKVTLRSAGLLVLRQPWSFTKGKVASRANLFP